MLNGSTCTRRGASSPVESVRACRSHTHVQIRSVRICTSDFQPQHGIFTICVRDFSYGILRDSHISMCTFSNSITHALPQYFSAMKTRMVLNTVWMHASDVRHSALIICRISLSNTGSPEVTKDSTVFASSFCCSWFCITKSAPRAAAIVWTIPVSYEHLQDTKGTCDGCRFDCDIL